MDEILLTAAQMRALERAAIESGAVTGLELMERAGIGAVAAIFAEWPELEHAPGRAVVLCGPGNNGGDGFVVARVLAGKGWEVEVFLWDDASPKGDAGTMADLWTGACIPLSQLDPADPFDFDLVVDALFGTGLGRPVDGLGDLFGTLRLDLRADAPAASDGPPAIVALDVPSGLDADSGKVLGEAPEAELPRSAVAHLTVAFGARKVGHLLGDGPARCGKVAVVPLPLALVPSPEGAVEVVGVADGCAALKSGGHKYAHGHALVLTGPMGRTGAARLSARAALRIGAGLVTCAAPGSAMLECAAQLTAIMLRRCDDADALAALLEDDRLNALCLGPGLGTDDRAAGLVATALASKRALVLDADALTLIAGDDTLRAALHPKCILTPHGGEFARLFPDIAERLGVTATTGPAYSKVDATRDAAAQAGCTVLFKGPDTVIADPSGRASVNAAVYARAAPWLATAGTGDVLAGMIAGQLARGLEPHVAASSAAWLHVEAALAFGPGLIAEDLPEALPGVFRALAAKAREAR